MTSKEKIYQNKIYNKFGVFLGRKKIDKSHAIAKLFLKKFAFSRDHKEWKYIGVDELRTLGVLSEDKLFCAWRSKMIKSGILICLTTKDEFEKKSVNMFKAGELIQKYIDMAIDESLPKRVEKVEDDICELQNLKQDVHKLKSDVQALTELVLNAIPSDNIHNKEKCIKLLSSQLN